MKKMYVGFSIFMLAVIMVSCGPSPVSFNNSLVKIQKSLLNSVDSLMPENDTTTNYIPKFEKAQGIVKGCIQQVEALEAPKDGVSLKSAMLESFRGLLDLYTSSIKSLEAGNKGDLNMQTKYQGEVADLQQKIEDLDTKVENEQRAFAKRHNFRLEK